MTTASSERSYMKRPTSFNCIYKSLGTHDIDVDVYLPTLPSSQGCTGRRMKWPICKISRKVHNAALCDSNQLTELEVINIHGGAFMLGSSKMVNLDQVCDCLDRGWVVVAPNHRLCPQVNLLDGPMRDCRDLLAWVYDGGLECAISGHGGESPTLDLDHVFAFGTSAGGTLALSLGFGVPRPVAGILDMYGPCNFAHPFWSKELPRVMAKLPKSLSDGFLQKVYEETPIPIEGGISLEGQAQGPPNFNDPRQAFAMTQVANGNVMNVIFPTKKWDEVDPLRNIDVNFPPTFIIHGEIDTMVPKELSRDLLQALQSKGVKCGMQEIPGEEHTFAARMHVGSQTWELQRRGFDFLQGLL